MTTIYIDDPANTDTGGPDWLKPRAPGGIQVFRFDPSQPRDDTGKWTDGAPSTNADGETIEDVGATIPEKRDPDAILDEWMSSPEEFAAAQKLAAEKARNVPKPTPEQIAKNLEMLAKSKRPGGWGRGNSYQRRARAQALFEEFGGKPGGSCPCAHCGIKVSPNGEGGFAKLTQDKILTAAEGGTYGTVKKGFPNLIPSCGGCNASRNQAEYEIRPMWAGALTAAAGRNTDVTVSEEFVAAAAVGKPVGWDTWLKAEVGDAEVSGEYITRTVDTWFGPYTQHLIAGETCDPETIVVSVDGEDLSLTVFHLDGQHDQQKHAGGRAKRLGPKVLNDDPDRFAPPESWSSMGDVDDAVTGMLDKLNAERDDGVHFEFGGYEHRPAGEFVAELGTVTVDIFDPDGKAIGVVNREFIFNDGDYYGDGGHMYAAHLYIDEAWQGKGIGTQIQEAFEDFAVASGFERVKVDAANVGRYTWARAGYDFIPDAGQMSTLARWTRKLGHEDLAEQFEYAEQEIRNQRAGGRPVMPISAPTPWEVAEVVGKEWAEGGWETPSWTGQKMLRTREDALAASGPESRQDRLDRVIDAYEQWWPRFPAAAEGADDPAAEAAWEALLGRSTAGAEQFHMRGRHDQQTHAGGVLADVPFRDVKIAYQPRHPDGKADPGEVVWARVPFEEGDGRSKDRPVLIIGRTSDGKSLVGVQLTSKRGYGRVSVGSGDWDRDGRESFMDTDRFIQVDDSNYRREGAYVKKPKFQAIVDVLTERQNAPDVDLAVETFHLQGQHDQADHGNRGGTAVLDSPAAALIAGEKVTLPAREAVDALVEIGRADDGVVDMTNLELDGNPYLFTGVRSDGRRDRAEMPQIPERALTAFHDHLEDEGVTFNHEIIDPASVRSTQTELDATKVGQMIARVQDGNYTTGHDPWVSNDGYILDGHHRWATMAVLSAAGEPHPPFNVQRVSLPIDELLTLADEFNAEYGIQSKTIGMAQLRRRVAQLHLQGQHDQQSHAGDNSTTDDDYQGVHRPSETGPRIHDLLESEMTDGLDVYENPQFFTGYSKQELTETMRQLRRVQGDPEAKVTIYRAAPEGAEIRDGDWVSLSKTYAETHADSGNAGNTPTILEMEVPAATVRWSVDDLMEYGYFPDLAEKRVYSEDDLAAHLKTLDDWAAKFRFDPGQPRDENGRWTSTGASDADAVTPASRRGWKPVKGVLSDRPVEFDDYEHRYRVTAANGQQIEARVFARGENERILRSPAWQQRIVDSLNGATDGYDIAPTAEPPHVIVIDELPFGLPEQAQDSIAFVASQGAVGPPPEALPFDGGMLRSNTITINATPRGREMWDLMEERGREIMMPSLASTSVAHYTGIHEYGHTRAQDDGIATLTNIYDGIRPYSLGSFLPAWKAMSPYGKMNAAEAHAETFADFVLTGGQSDNDATRYYADILGWTADDKPLAAAAGLAEFAAPKLREQWVYCFDGPNGGVLVTKAADGIQFGFDPNQPRDDIGRWTDGAEGGSTRFPGAAGAETERVAALARRGVDPAEFDGPVMHRGIAINVSDELKARIDNELYRGADPDNPDEFNSHLEIGPIIAEQLLGFEGHQGIERTGGIGQSWTTRESVAESVSAGPGNNVVVKVTARPRQSDIKIQEVDTPDGRTQYVDSAGNPIDKGRETDLVGGEMEVRIDGKSPVDIIDVQIQRGNKWVSVWGDERGFGAGADELYRQFPHLLDEMAGDTVTLRIVNPDELLERFRSGRELSQADAAVLVDWIRQNVLDGSESPEEALITVLLLPTPNAATFHLQGQHDQQSHAGGRGSGGGQDAYLGYRSGTDPNRSTARKIADWFREEFFPSGAFDVGDFLLAFFTLPARILQPTEERLLLAAEGIRVFHLQGQHDQKDHGRRGGASDVEFAPITADEARGNSRPVTADEFQRLAAIGRRQLDELAADTQPITALDENWTEIQQGAFNAAQESWGGATINARTGEFLASDADRYALTVKDPGFETVSVPENASQAEFEQAMTAAKEKFRPILERRDHYLGVFHDDDLNRIDFDPVTVVDTLDEVETIGAATRAIGGAYNFADGNGYWPPHVDEELAAVAASAGMGDMTKTKFKGPAEWKRQAKQLEGAPDAPAEPKSKRSFKVERD